ncbi:MAG: CAP domain-containing protein [Cyanobacteria bacterium J06629_19]
MKWTALWSLMLTGAMLASCGGESGGGNVSNDRTSSASAVEAIVSNDSCTPLNSYFSELRNLTNQARAKVNAAPLRFSLQLGKSAQGYAEDLATQNFFSHDGKDGSTFQSRIKATGYTKSGIGENLAAGEYTAQQTFTQWEESTTHYDNLLNPAFTEVGFGMFDTTGESTFGRYWVQHLGSDSTPGGIYIPNDCGLETLTTASKAPSQAVAGRSDLGAPSNGAAQQNEQSGTAYAGKGLTLPGNGTIPVGSLAFAAADATQGGKQDIPEPAILLGLAGLGLAMWRDRKVAQKKAFALTANSDCDTEPTNDV